MQHVPIQSLPPSQLDVLEACLRPGGVCLLAVYTGIGASLVTPALVHRWAVERGRRVAFVVWREGVEPVRRAVAWEDVAVDPTRPCHYRAPGEQVPEEQEALQRFLQAQAERPLFVITASAQPAERWYAEVLAAKPEIVLLARDDFTGAGPTPEEVRELARASGASVVATLPISPRDDFHPVLDDLPVAWRSVADVVLALSDHRYGEHEDPEAIPDGFFLDLYRLGARPAAGALVRLRYDLRTDRLVRHA